MSTTSYLELYAESEAKHAAALQAEHAARLAAEARVEKMELLALLVIELDRIVTGTITPDHEPNTLYHPQTGERVTGPIADAMFSVFGAISDLAEEARSALQPGDGK